MSDEPVVLHNIGERPAMRVTTRSGSVTVVAEDRSDIVFESGVKTAGAISRSDSGRIEVTSAKGGSASLAVRCPKSTNVAIGTTSGSVSLRGHLGKVQVTTMSGTIEVEKAEAADLRAVSGSIIIGACLGSCRLRTMSGRVEVGVAADTEISTASGKVRLGNAAGRISVRTASGTIEVGTLGSGDVMVQSLSGSVRVAVPEGVRPSVKLKSMSGRPRCDCPEGDDLRINVFTMSGKIEVVPT